MTTNLPSPDIAFSDTASQPDEQQVAIPKTSAAFQSSIDMKSTDHSDDSDAYQMDTPESSTSGKIQQTTIDAKSKISSLLKDKEQEWAAVVEKKGPLQLLDLPMDVLKEIVKEVRADTQLLARLLIISGIGYTYERLDCFSTNALRPPQSCYTSYIFPV
jgi:hypothetical protein